MEQALNVGSEGPGLEFIRTRIRKAIFEYGIPDPRDAIVIALVNTCDVFRFMFDLDEEAEERIDFLCRLDLIGRSIAAAVSVHVGGSLLRRSSLTRKIPRVALRKLPFNKNARAGNVSALFADLAKEYGPVYELRPPFGPAMIILAGAETNRWAHRNGRRHLRVKDYFNDFEKVYGANGVLPSLDGADHFRLRKSLAPAYSRARVEGRVHDIYKHARRFMADWELGKTYQATQLSRRMINLQLSDFMVSIYSQDIFEEMTKYKERALLVHIVKVLPKFMLKTPGMRRKAKLVEELLSRVQSVHTPAQRANAPRDLADDLLSLYASDPQLVPEANLRFAFSAALIASVYLGDAFSFALYAMASQPEFYAKIQAEADALFDNGDPGPDAFTQESIDVTHRFLMEVLRMYPIVPISIRNVMNTCAVEDYELPLGARVAVAQTAPHYMEEHFPEPHKFDIDRYLPPRNEHLGSGYAPFGLGTHTCLGSRWLELQLALNVLLVAHHFDIEVAPKNYKLRFNPLPSPKPNKKLKFRIAARRRDLPPA